MSYVKSWTKERKNAENISKLYLKTLLSYHLIMKCKTANMHTCLRFIGTVILLIGLSSAALIYATSRHYSADVLGYEDAGGSVYPVLPEDSKQYQRALQLYGGTANVLADELRRWFDGLWHGQSLALTVAFITIFISSGIFYAANRLPVGSQSDSGDQNTHSRTS
jgi:hypothetical protein